MSRPSNPVASGSMVARGTWAFAGLVIALLTGCPSPREVEKADAGPTVLRLGYTPSEETVADREEANEALAAYLQDRLGIPIHLVRTASYGPAIEAMARGEIDFMSLGPFVYTLASAQGVAEAIAVTGHPSTGPRTYRSVLIGSQRSGLKNLDEVRSRARNLRFNYTDPASNSGHLVPQARLVALGLDPERDFASVEFTLSHTVAVLNVVHGRAEIAGVSDSTLQRLIAKKRVRAEDLIVLWTSDALPNGPMAVRANLPETLKRKLQQALVELPTRDPAASRRAMAQFSSPNLIFLPCEDSLYDGLRRLAQTVEKR